MTATTTRNPILKMKFTLRFFGSLILLVVAFAGEVFSQSVAPIHPINGSYIKEWLVLGPFFPDNLETDFLDPAGGEENVNPKEGDTILTADGEEMTWTRYRSKSDSVDLLSALGNYYENATAYAFCILQSETAGEFQISLGSDDGVAVFLNGKRVHYNDIVRGLVFHEDWFVVPLLAGKSRCLVKISSYAGLWEFATAVLPGPDFVIPAKADSPNNHVLSLDGSGDYVQLPADISNDLYDLDAATVEFWAKWEAFQPFSQPVGFGEAWQAMGVNNFDRTPKVQFYVYDRHKKLYLTSMDAPLPADQWYHIAGATGPNGMKLYINGVLIQENSFTGSFSSVGAGKRNFFGRSQWRYNADFKGRLDEIRIWKGERTQPQIQENMHGRLKGNEPGLFGLWNFDADDARDRSSNGFHGEMHGDSHCVPENLPSPDNLSTPMVCFGRITDTHGNPLPNARVHIESQDVFIAETQSNEEGEYNLACFVGDGFYELGATHGAQLGTWFVERRWQHGRQRLDIRLAEAFSISGTLTRFDGRPHSGVVVDAV